MSQGPRVVNVDIDVDVKVEVEVNEGHVTESDCGNPIEKQGFQVNTGR